MAEQWIRARAIRTELPEISRRVHVIHSGQIDLTNQRRYENGQKQEQRGYDQHSCFAPLQLDSSGGECFGPHGHDSMQDDQKEYECQLDMQPRRVKIIVGIRRDQASAGQYG